MLLAFAVCPAVGSSAAPIPSRGLAKLELAVQRRLGAGRAAAGLFERALAIDPKSAPVLAGLGRLALAGNDFQAAVQRLELALSADTQASALYYPLAMAYRGLGQTEKARDLLTRRGPIKPA